MLTSSSPYSQTLARTKSPTKSIPPSDAVDISKSRQLLKSTNEFGSVVLTPRKRALARKYKDKDNNNKESDKKEESTSTPASIGLASPPPSSHKQIGKATSLMNLKLDDPVYIKSEQDYDPEERITLFGFPKASIHTFEDNTDTLDDSQKQGRLLGHGLFEVYQMHMKKVSYFHCGSVVYPIFPRLKILKISKNQFILPLSNPERYWKINVETNDESVITELEDVFKRICHFRNLYIKPSNEPSQPNNTSSIETIPSSKSQASISSITSAVACFNLESDSSTFVDQFSSKSTPIANPDGSFTEREEDYDNHTDEEGAPSIVSSLDSALEDFKESAKPMSFNDHFDTTHYYTPRSSAHQTTIMDESRDTILFSPTQFPNQNTSLLNSHPRSRSSRSASLYISESSWMDPTDEPEPKTSTPATQRYIEFNLNPNPRFVDSKKKKNYEKRIMTDPTISKKNNRYSSYDIYNILCDENENNEPKEGPAGFTGFLKSFF